MTTAGEVFEGGFGDVRVVARVLRFYGNKNDACRITKLLTRWSQMLVYVKVSKSSKFELLQKSRLACPRPHASRRGY